MALIASSEAHGTILAPITDLYVADANGCHKVFVHSVILIGKSRTRYAVEKNSDRKLFTCLSTTDP